MPETADDRKKNAVIKVLAIIGFIVTLTLVAWLAVQAVRLAPSVAGMAASVAGRMRGTESEFAVSAGTHIINTGEALTISWTAPERTGAYHFSYRCADGVVAEIQGEQGLSTLPCDAVLPLADTDRSLAVIFSSEKKRFVDVTYTIALMNDDEVVSARENIITVVNPAISATATRAEEDVTPVAVEETSPVATTTPVMSPQNPIVPTVVSILPVSNPTGSADLAVAFIGIGTYDTVTEVFTPHASLSENTRSAVRFEVKNVGTKTSGLWYFSIKLPTTPASTYASSATAVLKPGERQVITLQFDAPSRTSDRRITVAITGGDDRALSNNTFSRQVEIIR